MDRNDIVAAVRDHADEIRARGVARLGLFGSLARGDGGVGSDVDIVIDLAPGRAFSLLDLAGLRAYLCDLLRRETDVVVREDLREAFRTRIDRDTLPIL